MHCLIKNVLCITRLMPKLSEIGIYKSSYPVCGSAENIDVLLTEGFFTKEGKVYYVQHAVDNEESALARLTFCENLLIR